MPEALNPSCLISTVTVFPVKSSMAVFNEVTVSVPVTWALTETDLSPTLLVNVFAELAALVRVCPPVVVIVKVAPWFAKV